MTKRKEELPHLEEIRKRFIKLNREFIKRGVPLNKLKYVCETEMTIDNNNKSIKFDKKRYFFLIILLPIIFGLIIYQFDGDEIIKQFEGTRCLIPNNYLTWEFTRPVSNCDFCRGINSALILNNLTRDEFKKYAYSSKPIIVKKAASKWLAAKVFSIQFFRSLYDNIDGAYESIDEECQFLHFRTNFVNLKEVFSMSERRAMNLPGEESWYVGWKNCHPQVLEIMRQFYETPHFLPDDADVPNTNYIFMGYDQGAVMHLDYIPRLMWQGQIIGSKTWRVAPTPECDDICQPFSFFVDTGDVILLDTRIWYHGTQVENGKFSLTLTSEYG